MPKMCRNLLTKPLSWSNIHDPSKPIDTLEMTNGRKMIDR